MYGTIEAGGTKFVCALGNERFEVVKRESFPTTTPEETMERVYQFFDGTNLTAMGVGSFGPIDINPASPTYGYITHTPKTKWKHYNLLEAVKSRYQVPTGWTTDVNLSALGESYNGAGQGKRSILYLTVGTGIGGGAVVDGRILEGFGHPEMGHITVPKHPDDREFAGICPYHGDCLEGLSSGPTIDARLQKKGVELPEDHPIWDVFAHYLAHGVLNYTMMLRPERIILGGGVMKSPLLLSKVQKLFTRLVNDYVELPDPESYLVRPAHGDNAAVIGGFVLAEQICRA